MSTEKKMVEKVATKKEGRKMKKKKKEFNRYSKEFAIKLNKSN